MAAGEAETTEGAADYRVSHLHKGGSYDFDLARDDLARLLAAEEATLLRKVILSLFPHGIRRSVDFACGTGRITEIVEQFAAEPFGVDVSESMVEQARAKCSRTRFFVADATTEPVPITDASLVTAFRFLGNAGDGLRREALRAISGMMEDGGYLIVNNHRNPWAIHDLLLRLRGRATKLDLTWWKLRRLLADAGFEIVRTWPIAGGVLRYRWLEPPLLDSRRRRWTSALLNRRLFAPFAPDMIVVARKKTAPLR